MAEKKPAAKSKAKSAAKGFTAEEKAAMRDRAREMKGEGEGERAVLEKIAGMSKSDRAMAERVHAVIMAAGPDLVPRLWYGMPAYAKAGQVVCFFQGAEKFKSRYATLGFSDKANLDEGRMWPTGFALMNLTAAEETRIGELVKRAVG